MKVSVKGLGSVSLDRSDFRARGGEGSVFVKGDTAYKIFDDPQRVIAEGKISELVRVDHPDILRPERLVLDSRNVPVGYTMRAVSDVLQLCQMFPLAFRKRHGLTPEAVATLVGRFRNVVAHVHSGGALIVDLNEMNFLLTAKADRIYFVDVDSYQTASYPATALMDSIRDRHAKEFGQESDWFSFAVVSFQMFTGIHPYRGTYAPFQGKVDKSDRLDARMRANISVLNSEVTVPAAALPLDVIPPNYLAWYGEVLERGLRLPPPQSVALPTTLSIPRPRSMPGALAGRLRVEELWNNGEDIVDFVDGFVQTDSAVYFEGERLGAVPRGARLVLTARLTVPICAWIEERRLRLLDVSRGREIPIDLEVDAIAVADRALICVCGSSLIVIQFVETAARIIAGARVLGNVHPRSTLLRDGVALQNLCGSWYASIISAQGCSQVRIAELDPYRIIDAKHVRGVLVVIGEQRGRYDRIVIRFDTKSAGTYECRETADVTYAGISMAVLDSGVALMVDDSDQLEVFHANARTNAVERISDPGLSGDAKLFAWGARALFASGGKLCTVSARS